MPILALPKTPQEHDLWVKAVAASSGCAVEGISKGLKYKLQQRFIVANGRLVCRETNKRVLVQSDFDDLWKKHHDEANHPGLHASIEGMKAEVAAVPKSLAIEALNDCQICRTKTTIKKAPVGKPMRSSAIWGRVGIDLIDMSSRPDNDYKWIYHAKDHASKFSYAVPLKSKCCEEVSAAVRQMFYLYGVPQILQHDRGGEFVGHQMKDMMAREFSQCKVIKSSPRRPTTNGLIERENKVLEERLLCWMQQAKRSDWSTALAEIKWKRNNEWTRTLKGKPAEMFFGRKSHESIAVVSTEDDDDVEAEDVDFDDDVDQREPTAPDADITPWAWYQNNKDKFEHEVVYNGTMTAVDADGDVADIVESLPGTECRDISVFIFGSVRDEQLMHAEGRKRDWGLSSSIIAPRDVRADVGDFPDDLINATPTSITYFNRLAQEAAGDADEPMQDEPMQDEPMQDEPNTETENNDLYLLYKFETGQPEKAVAVGRLDPTRKLVHGQGVGPKEGAFEVVSVLDQEAIGPDDEPLQANSFLVWPMNRASNNLGRDEETIRFRSSMFMQYLKNRGHAQQEWLKVAQREELKPGDHVLLNIPRVDRTSTCPRAMEGEVAAVNGAFVRVRTSAGLIETSFRQDQLQKIRGTKRPLEVRNDSVTFISAARAETALSNRSMCNCQMTANRQCKDKTQCTCFRNNLRCSSKCHKGKPCDLSK
uniref:Integrase catalytic domain-containing protein n=1 Tax=Plectus sambesii TaxID=2011161 RepID=A0A914XJJ4_9BILA